jgi:hypothetical protein
MPEKDILDRLDWLYRTFFASDKDVVSQIANDAISEIRDLREKLEEINELTSKFKED